MSKRKPEKAAMHVAWRIILAETEAEIAATKAALRKSPLLGRHEAVIRLNRGDIPGFQAAVDAKRGESKIRAHLREQIRLVKVLYDLRLLSKSISKTRWDKRHQLYPERPPICGKPSRHPEFCGCKLRGEA